MPEGARLIGKPFTADMVHVQLKEILPDGRKPASPRDMARSAVHCGLADTFAGAPH